MSEQGPKIQYERTDADLKAVTKVGVGIAVLATVVALAAMVPRALEAAERLKGENRPLKRTPTAVELVKNLVDLALQAAQRYTRPTWAGLCCCSTLKSGTETGVMCASTWQCGQCIVSPGGKPPLRLRQAR